MHTSTCTVWASHKGSPQLAASHFTASKASMAWSKTAAGCWWTTMSLNSWSMKGICKVGTKDADGYPCIYIDRYLVVCLFIFVIFM